MSKSLVGIIHVGIWGKKLPSRGNSKCRGPEAGLCAWRVQGIARKPCYGAVRTEWVRHEAVGNEFREMS